MPRKTIQCSVLSVTPELSLFYTGASLDKGAMPTLFYFATSGEDSLCLDPFNQLIQFLNGDPIRIFSMNLPAHEPPLPPTEAMAVWADDLTKGKETLSHFLDQAEQGVRYLIDQRLLNTKKMVVAGLSRGGFIAAHLAARMKEFRFLLQLSPLTTLSAIKEFKKKTHPSAEKFDLKHLTKELADRHTRVYIGNRDLRVGTKEAFDFVQNLSEAAYEQGLLSPQVEMILFPSIGHLGHGTSPEVFKAGADWIAEALLNGKQ